MYKVTKTPKCTELPKTELEDLTVKNTLCTLNTYPWGQTFHPFCSTISHFRHKVAKNQNYSIHTKCLPPKAQNFGLFRSTIINFRDTTCTRSPKFGNALNDPKLNLTTWQSKLPYIHQILTPDVQILVRFALRPAVSKISHSLSFSIDYHVKGPKKNTKKC